MQMLTNSVETTESHRKGLTHVISRMDWYWALAQSLLEPSHASGTRLGLENQIVDLYRKLLLYQIRSICSFFGNRGVVFMRDLIQFDSWEGQLESIRKAEDQFRHDTMTYSMLRQYSGFEEIRHQLEQLAEGVKFQATQLAHQCMKDLYLTDPELDKMRIEESKGDLLPGAYRWVLKDSSFRQWRDGSGSQLLWVKGGPGKGKTMLLCGIIDELRPAVQLTDVSSDTVVAHFFCQATDARLNRASGVLRGLIYMLAKKQPSLVSHIQKHHQDAGQKLFEDHNAWFALQGILQDVLHNLAPNTTTYLVIDALDECEEDLPQLLKFIVSNSTIPSVKWIVSSRKLLEISEGFARLEGNALLSLDIGNCSPSDAIDHYIQEKVRQLTKLKDYDQVLADSVREHCSRNADGTFLWVSLVCKSLEAIYWNGDVPKALNSFPLSLDALYERMFSHIGRSQSTYVVELCHRILSIATVVYSPVSLDELRAISRVRDIRRAIDLCGSFLTVRDNTVYLIHQSAKDFLTDPEKCAYCLIFPQGLEETHSTIFQWSKEAMEATPLKQDIYGLARPGCLIDEVNQPDRDPLAVVRYPCIYWLDHLHDSASGEKGARNLRPRDIDSALSFLEEHLLHWLEALSLLRHIPSGILGLRKLEALLVSSTYNILSIINGFPVANNI